MRINAVIAKLRIVRRLEGSSNIFKFFYYKAMAGCTLPLSAACHSVSANIPTDRFTCGIEILFNLYLVFACKYLFVWKLFCLSSYLIYIDLGPVW